MSCRVTKDSLDETSQRGTDRGQGPSRGAGVNEDAYLYIGDFQIRLDWWSQCHRVLHYCIKYSPSRNGM